MLPVQENHQQYPQIPQALIEERGMDLDVVSALCHMGCNALGDLSGTHRFNGQAHGKKPITVLSKGLPVGEVAPPSDNLPCQKTHDCRISHLEETLFSDFAEDKQG